MLKIKENVDLKELEKFGFLKYGGYEECYHHHYYIKVLKSYFFQSYKELFIDADSRNVEVFEYDCILGKRRLEIRAKRRWIKDLIKARLSRKGW